MGKRGPKPTPTAVLRMRGSWRAGERSNEVVPLKVTEIDIPLVCQQKSHKIYLKFAEELRAIGLFTKNDSTALACFCNAMMQYVELQEEIDKDGMFVWSKKGKKLHPAFSGQRMIYAELCKGFAQFGLSPSDRAGLCATVQEIQTNAETKASLFKLA